MTLSLMIKKLNSMVVGLCLGGTVAMAAGESTPAQPPGETVTIHDLIVAALNTNLELQAKRIDPQLQQFKIKEAWGSFDPTFGVAGWYSVTDQPQNQRDFLATGSTSRIYNEHLIHYEAGFTGKLPTGAQYSISSSIERSDNTFNEQAAALYRPEFMTRTSITLTQPLLRDFGTNVNLAEVHLSKTALAVSRQELNATVIKVLAQVSSAYFEMVFGQENVGVKQEAVHLAQNLVRESERRVQEGKMSIVDVVQARQRLSEAQEELVLAHNFLAQRRNTLRSLTRDHIDFDEADWFVEGSFLSRVAPHINRNALVLALFEHSPTYLGQIELAKAEDVRIAYAKNQLWPHVDLKASFGENGLSGGWSTAYTDIRNRREPSWSAGLVVNVPITARTERARIAEAKSRKAQALLNIKQVEVQLLSAFDSAIQDLKSAEDRLDLVRESVKLAETALHAEEKRLENGTTTSYNVAVLQKDLSTARSRELATYVDLNKAVTALYALVGTLPDQLQTEVKFN